jgi:hypothetical protein
MADDRERVITRDLTELVDAIEDRTIEGVWARDDIVSQTLILQLDNGTKLALTAWTSHEDAEMRFSLE